LLQLEYPREKLQVELQTIESQGSIAPVTVSTEWCAPIVVAPQKDPEEIRMSQQVCSTREIHQSPSLGSVNAEGLRIILQGDVTILSVHAHYLITKKCVLETVRLDHPVTMPIMMMSAPESGNTFNDAVPFRDAT
jgi:hypothetical protein